MAKKYIDEIGLSHFYSKIKEKLGGKSSIGHTHSSSEVSGLSKVATTNDFNDLTNLPFYPSLFNITWNGDKTGLTEVLSNNITIGAETQQFSYYKLSDKIISSNDVVGANLSVMIDVEESYTITTSNIKFADGKTGGSFYITFENMSNLPIVFCIQEPTTFVKTIAIDETIEVSTEFEFTDTGIYFIYDQGVYITSFVKEGKQLDKEFIPDIYQEKSNCPQLDMGYCGSNSTGNFIYNYIYLVNGASNPNPDPQKLAYNITVDSFVLPIIMSNTVNPTDGIITLKVVTGVNSLGNPTDSISIDILCKTPLYSEKTYFLVAVKKSNGTCKGWIVGKADSPVDTTPTSGSENLITSGGVYDAINSAIGNALGGSY